ASVTQYDTTCVSGAGASVRSILSVRWLALLQFIGSLSIAQHALLVDDAGVPRLLHSGRTFSIWFALPKLVTSDTEQSYCGPGVFGSTSARLPSMHGLPSTVLRSCAISVRPPERSCWQIDENVLRFGNESSSCLMRTGGSATSTA